MSCFAGKVAVITGAGSGIGRALAQQLAAKGARLALSDVNATGLEATVVSLPAGCDARSYALDVSNRRAVFDHADAVQRDFGTAHFVINNAGVTVVGTIAHLTIEEIEWQLGINLWGVIYGTKAFLPMMLAQREGCIVNISSVFGLVGVPDAGRLQHLQVRRARTDRVPVERARRHRRSRRVRAPRRHPDQHRESGAPLRRIGRRRSDASTDWPRSC